LLAACNPCPCGFFDVPEGSCSCTPGQILRYKRKLSGPVLDRIDMVCSVGAVNPEKLLLRRESLPEGSEDIRRRVVLSRVVQKTRFKGTGTFCNGEMSNKQVKYYCKMGAAEEMFLNRAASLYKLSARAFFKTIKVARTIADLSSQRDISTDHLAEALQYRPRDK
jgi:magnesium chelatase family protein